MVMKMNIDRISTKIMCFMNKDVYLTSVEQDKMHYALSVIISELSKALILFILFGLVGYPLEFLTIYLFTIFLRVNIGGFHFSTYLGCLIFSFIYVILVLLVDTIVIDNLIHITLAALCIIVLSLLAPVISPQRLEIQSNNITILKLRSILMSLFYIVIHVAINSPYTRFGLWVIIIQSLFIAYSKGVELYERKRRNKNCTGIS